MKELFCVCLVAILACPTVWAQTDADLAKDLEQIANDSGGEFPADDDGDGEVAPQRAKAPRPVAKAKKGEKGQSAMVGIEGATIYQAPDFDSPVLLQVQAGQKAVISLQTYPGRGGLGLFYKVRVGKGKFGYVADIDVIPQFKKTTTGKTKRNDFYEDVENVRQMTLRGLDPIYYTRYGGVGVHYVNISEKANGQTYRGDSYLLNFKFTGPGVLFDGPPLDINLGFAMEPPSYYRSLSVGNPSGYFLMGDLSLLAPFAEEYSYLFYGGLGVMWSYADFRVPKADGAITAREWRAGAVATVGFIWRINRFGLRLDAKYYYEKSSYFGAGFAVQRQF